MEKGGLQSWRVDSLKAEARQGKGFATRASSKEYHANDSCSPVRAASVPNHNCKIVNFHCMAPLNWSDLLNQPH